MIMFFDTMLSILFMSALNGIIVPEVNVERLALIGPACKGPVFCNFQPINSVNF